MEKIILASKSPRRMELLKQMGIEFECIPAVGKEELDESIFIEKNDYVEFLAIQKAREVAKKVCGRLIVAADTLVELDGEFLGKPGDSLKAKEMLMRLSGKSHLVHTGVCILKVDINENISNMESFSETTRVYFKQISEDEIDRYVATGEPLDKAGAYAIQGKASVFIPKIDGDYYNVVGLPISRLYDELKKFK